MDKKTIRNILAEFVEKNIEILEHLEKISILIFAIGFILFYLKQPKTDFILVIGSIMMTIIYFLNIYKVIETENLETTGILNSIGFINFLYKLMYLSLSISAIAALGLVVKLNNHITLIYMSGFTLITILILSLMTKLNDRSIIYNTTFYIRIVICLLLLTYLVMIKYNFK